MKSYEVYCDVSITRRKRYHLIMAPSGEIVFRSRYFGEVLEWLWDSAETNFVIQTEETRFTASSSLVHTTRR